MQAIVDVVLPVFGLIFAGFLAGRFGVLGLASIEAIIEFVYRLALPAILFLGMARVPAGAIVRELQLIAPAPGTIWSSFSLRLPRPAASSRRSR